MSNSILLSIDAKGRFLEGIISGTPKPGTCVQVKAATEPVGGRHTWEVYNRDADANRYLVAVLLEAYWLGRGPTDAYVSGEYCRLYCPVPGDELNMLIANVAGTSDTFAIGDLLIIDDGTGKLVATTGSPEAEPFIMMETTSTALTADTLKHCMFTGY